MTGCRLAQWSDEQVAIHRPSAYPGHKVEEYFADQTQNDVQMLLNQPKKPAQMHLRLSDIS